MLLCEMSIMSEKKKNQEKSSSWYLKWKLIDESLAHAELYYKWGTKIIIMFGTWYCISY